MKKKFFVYISQMQLVDFEKKGLVLLGFFVLKSPTEE